MPVTDSIAYRCSLVIPTKNGGELFRQLTDRLQKQTLWPMVEFIVIDSGSTDETVSIARAAHATVYSIPPQEFNHGLTRDYGISSASSAYIILMVQDAIPADNFLLERLVAALEEERVAGVYARQIPQNTADILVKRNLNSWLTAGFERKFNTIESREWYDRLSPIEKYHFCNFDNVCSAIKKAAWKLEQFGEIDFGEDVDWAERILKQKFAIVFDPTAVVVHSHDRSMTYEYKRTYTCHRFLYRKFGLRLVPSLLSLWTAWWRASISDIFFVSRAKQRISQKYKLLLKIPAYNLLMAIAQYRAASDEIRGVDKKLEGV